MENEEEEVQHSDAEPGTQTQCRALLDNGCRCKNNKVLASGRKHLCTRHNNEAIRGSTPATVPNCTHNPQLYKVQTDHLDDTLKLAQCWRDFYPLLKQSTPYYIDAYGRICTSRLQNMACNSLREDPPDHIG